MNSILSIVLICAGVPVLAQPAQSFQPTVLIQAKQGTGPGEFAARPGEEPSAMGPAVDSQEHIYILAPLNNCLQTYDGTGTYLGCVHIQSSSMPDENLRKAGHEGLESDMLHFGVVDDAVYALKLSRRTKHLLRLEGKSFVDDDPDLPSIWKKLPTHWESARQVKSALMHLGLTDRQFLTKYPKETGALLEGIYWDMRSNLWVVSAMAVRIYDPADSLIHEIKARGIWSGHTFSKRGNLYVMETDDSGIRVSKYSLQGK